MRLSPLAAALAAALLIFASAATAKQRPITGKLAKNGYTVIALSYDGAASSARIKSGRFSVVPPASRVTLSLRDKAGVYAGPIVVGKKGSKVVLGVKAGAPLGKLKLAKGFAPPAK